jgi:unsaturated rhamnogalacturonyl hydrolase
MFATARSSDSARLFDGATPLEWSVRLARSEMARRGASLNFGGAPRARWDYASGLFADALERLGSETAGGKFGEYGAAIVDSYVSEQGAIRTYSLDDFNLDSVEPGRALLASYFGTHEERLRKAAELLRRQLALQPRTAPGIFWHKLRYRDQVWLDGLYMAQPFYAAFGEAFGEPAALADVARQVAAADSILYDPGSGLYYHGWDQGRRQAWADRATGRSPSFWSRSIGWYAMAVVDVLDWLPDAGGGTGAVREIEGRAARGVARWQDPSTGVWWQVTDQGARPGNYLESSASSMFVYALAKGVNRGYLSRQMYEAAILRGYGGLIREFVRKGPDGEFSLVHCCSVAGLGNAAGVDGRTRSGSFDYYVSEPIVDNDLKGVAPFILAGIETGRMLSSAGGPRAVRDAGTPSAMPSASAGTPVQP